MITITPAAAEQIRTSARQGQMTGMAMRIAATRNPDGTLHYGMGFDDNQMDGDVHVNSEDIEIVVSESSMQLVQGMTLDFHRQFPRYESPQFDTNYRRKPRYQRPGVDLVADPLRGCLQHQYRARCR
jgi:iron-sulfur cluster assembly protein